MSKSSMFLCDTTNIDYAYIDEVGGVIGGSLRPMFIVSGEVDEKEKVVVDFSTIKKALKKMIDDPEMGFDHKLWWINGLSGGTIEFIGDQVKIRTKEVDIDGPANMVRVWSNFNAIEEYLNVELNKVYPNIGIKIELTPSTNFDLPIGITTKAYSFRYVHGLKDSTSWGCQNIAHGHLSYVCATSTSSTPELEILVMKIAAAFDRTIFVNEENFNHHRGMSYDCSRGHMKMIFHNMDHVTILETETTIEFLVKHIAKAYEKELRECGVTELYVSEGLSKGAVWRW